MTVFELIAYRGLQGAVEDLWDRVALLEDPPEEPEMAVQGEAEPEKEEEV